MSPKAIVLLVVRILIILVCLFFVCKSELESTIVNKTRTFPYEINEVYCPKGGKSGSYLKIEDRGKIYSVFVSGYQHCSSFKEGGKVELYYNDLLDYYFFKEENKPFGIIICMVLFGLTFIWPIVDRYKTNNQIHK